MQDARADAPARPKQTPSPFLQAPSLQKKYTKLGVFSFFWVARLSSQLKVVKRVCVCVVALFASPTSPRTAQSCRLPSGPRAGPLGATAASEAGGGGPISEGVGRAMEGAIVSSPPTKSMPPPLPPRLLDLAIPREDSSARIEAVLVCVVIVAGFTFRIRIFLRGAGFPVEPGLGSGGAATSAVMATISLSRGAAQECGRVRVPSPLTIHTTSPRFSYAESWFALDLPAPTSQ